MPVLRPIAALGAVVLAAAALGQGPAAAAPADPTPTVPDRAASSVRVGGDAGRRDAQALLAARSARTTTTFAVRTSRASATPGVRAAASRLGGTLAPATAGTAKLGWTSVTVPAAEAKATRARLAALPGVSEVVEAQPRFPDYVPNDSLYGARQAPMMTALQAPTAWDIAQGSGVAIAVLDGGFDVTHPDLASKIDSTWDVVSGNATVTDSPTDTVPGHGTAAASVAAAATNNSAGIAGAAPLARLLLVQVGDDAQSGEITDLTSADGIVWAVDHGADVISMSYGATGTPSAPESEAVAYAVANDVVVIASAGNDGLSSVHYPAGLPSVIAVGATNNTGTAQAAWSTYGTWVDVAAPGEDIPVALPDAADDDGVVDGYSLWDGTSFAGPLVAGLAAVLRSANPSATEAEVRAALTTTTKPITLTNSGFAHGLVQSATAARVLVNPIITAPAAAAELSGTVTVSATSAAPYVRFSVDGTTVATKIATSGGTASGPFDTYGLAGDVTLRAQGCTATLCGPGTTQTVSVTNAAPVLTSPADSVLVETSLTLSATAAGGAVAFLADGTQSLGVDKTAPYSLTIDTAALSDGDHEITAVLCSADGSECDTATPSNASTITVQRLRPTVRVSPTVISPNADGRRDSTVATYTFEQRQTGTLRVKTAGGTVVRTVSLGTKDAGSYTWTWNGRNTAGTIVPNSTYTVEVTTTSVIADVTWKGAATAKVTVDKTKPVASSVTPSSSSFYPYRDGFKDTSSLGATSNEALSTYSVYITSSSGVRVRTITGGAKPAGRVAATWNGLTNSGRRAADGVYAFQVLMQDVAGNQTLSAKGRVTIAWKKLTAKTGTRTISAQGAAIGYVYDATFCSRVTGNARPGVWPSSSLAYESVYSSSCTSDGAGDVAFSLSQFILPTALKYGVIKVTPYGGGSTYGSGHTSDLGEIDYVLKDSTSIGRWSTLSSGTGKHDGPVVAAADYLIDGKKFRWWTGAGGGNWYDVRDFTVTWTYYVLV